MGTRTPINGTGPAGTNQGTADPGAGSGTSSGPGSPPRGAGPGPSPAVVERLEPVGLVGGDSPERLIAEVEGAAASAPISDPVTGQPIEQQQPPPNVNGEWQVLTPPVVEVVAAVVFPRWNIGPDKQKPLSESLAECMDQLFPGGVDGKYACWVRLIAVMGTITVGAAAENNGRLPPLFSGTTKPAQPAPINPMDVTSLTQ